MAGQSYYPAERACESELFELFEADGIRVFVPQPQVREMLKGKTLDLDGDGRLVALPRSSK